MLRKGLYSLLLALNLNVVCQEQDKETTATATGTGTGGTNTNGRSPGLVKNLIRNGGFEKSTQAIKKFCAKLNTTECASKEVSLIFPWLYKTSTVAAAGFIYGANENLKDENLKAYKGSIALILREETALRQRITLEFVIGKNYTLSFRLSFPSDCQPEVVPPRNIGYINLFGKQEEFAPKRKWRLMSYNFTATATSSTFRMGGLVRSCPPIIDNMQLYLSLDDAFYTDKPGETKPGETKPAPGAKEEKIFKGES